MAVSERLEGIKWIMNDDLEKLIDSPEVESASEDVLKMFAARNLTLSQSLVALAILYHLIRANVKDKPDLAREYEKMFCMMAGIERA